MRIFKRILLILSALVLLFGAAAGFFGYKTRLEKNEVLRSCAPDGSRELTVYMIGEPDWPYGYTHCRFELKEGKEMICGTAFDVANDGAPVGKESFSVTWDTESVSVTVSGEEQPDTLYTITFDGKCRQKNGNT